MKLENLCLQISFLLDFLFIYRLLLFYTFSQCCSAFAFSTLLFVSSSLFHLSSLLLCLLTLPPSLLTSFHSFLFCLCQVESAFLFHQCMFLPGFLCGSDGKESTYNSGDPGSIPGSGRSAGEENGNPLQYSFLENSIDRVVWQAAVHGITKSWT